MHYTSKREWRRHLRKRKPKRQGSGIRPTKSCLFAFLKIRRRISLHGVSVSAAEWEVNSWHTFLFQRT